MDVFGQAILAYFDGDKDAIITTETTISEKDELPVDYLYRDYGAMPILEQKALDICNGSILDIGCGAGSHALYLQQQGLEVVALDLSKGAVAVCKQRGVQNTVCMPILSYADKQFDTLLLLMNGIGLAGNEASLNAFLVYLKSLLKPNGQLLLDSSDIHYMYDAEDISELDNYYGELKFTISFHDLSETFGWLFLDFERLKVAAEKVGLRCEKVYEGEHHDYLAKLTKISC